MDKIRVLHIYKSFNVYNGLIEILLILAKHLDRRRFELSVAVQEYDGNEFGREFERIGGKIFNLNVRRGAVREPLHAIGLVNVIRTYRPHIVQTHVLKANLLGAFLAKVSGVPVVIGTEMTLKDTAPTHLRRFRDDILQPLTWTVLSHCDKFVVTSHYIRREWAHDGREELFEVIYPPFSIDKYRCAYDKRRQTRGDTICFVGRLSEEKGLPVLLDAMARIVARMPSAKLVIVGEGPLAGSLQCRTASLGLEHAVRFAGYAANTFEALAGADVFVLPSRTEGCPIVVLEAMAMGLPVVATAVGGTVELVRHNCTGILVPYGNAELTADALLRLLGDPEMRSEMGKKAFDVAFTTFHPDKFTARLQELYEELLSAKSEDGSGSERKASLVPIRVKDSMQ